MENKRTTAIDLGLTAEEKETLHKIARDAIECKIKDRELPHVHFDSQLLNENRGAFVSLHRRGSLRGCIGFIQAVKPLHTTIKDMAEAAAFHDPRFEPLQENELDDLEIEISVLTPMKEISNTDEIEVGRHGLMITKGYASGLLLPQVATEYEWDRETFLEHTCTKAGLHTSAWKDKDTKIYLFTADVF